MTDPVECVSKSTSVFGGEVPKDSEVCFELSNHFRNPVVKILAEPSTEPIQNLLGALVEPFDDIFRYIWHRRPTETNLSQAYALGGRGGMIPAEIL